MSYFTQACSSWINPVEGWCAELERRYLERGDFRSLDALEPRSKSESDLDKTADQVLDHTRRRGGRISKPAHQVYSPGASATGLTDRVEPIASVRAFATPAATAGAQHGRKPSTPHRNASPIGTGRPRLARCTVEDGWITRRAVERSRISRATAVGGQGSCGIATVNGMSKAVPARSGCRNPFDQTFAAHLRYGSWKITPL